MGAREAIVRAMMARKLPGQTTAADMRELNAYPRGMAAQDRAQSLMADTAGDRAAAIQQTQNTLDRYQAFNPISDRNAQFIGKQMRQADEVMGLLNDPATTFDERWWR